MLRIIMTLWKIVQRHTYDLLSRKYSVIIVLICISTIIVSFFQFGEVWMTWSQEEYDTVFNSFSDNIVGKSLQSKLCQNIPIDVVYTWVNGSDPILLQQLQHYRQQLQEEVSKKCPYANCVPSHIITIRHWLSDEAVADALLPSGVRGTNASLRHRVTVENNNWTLIEVNSAEEAAEAVKCVLQSNVTLLHAHWTSDNTVPKTNGDAVHAVLISGIPSSLLEGAGSILKSELTRNLQSEIQNVWVFSEKKLVVIKVDSSESVSRILELPRNVTIGGHTVSTSKAQLILQLPFEDNSKDFSPSRFEDKEELRYSLRSLERYAPWVRHVYLVTNGQIPYWLDLENPRLTVVTHDQIFPNLSHLPTFSSPAIESHIHRIPGLSRKFLYLNDDVMFGKEVWPDDFITNSNGQKVYLSWPVPDCSDGCPWSWVADGSCDVSCNISECSFDGGDCDLSAEDIGLYDENRHLANYDDDFISYNENQHHYAHDFVNDDLFHKINFGGDVVLEDLPDPRKRIGSLLDILMKKSGKKEDFKGNLTYFREVDKMTHMNPNDRNASDLHNTTPVTYRHNSINKFHVYGISKLHSEKTSVHQMGRNHLQPNDEIYGGERNDTLYLERIAQVQQKKEDNTKIGNSSGTSGSTIVFRHKQSEFIGKNIYKKTKLDSNNVTSNYHISQSHAAKLLVNSSTNSRDHNMEDAGVHGEFYPGPTSQGLSYIKANELQSNGIGMFVMLRNGQNVSGIDGSQNTNIVTKSNETNGTEKTVNSRNMKRKPVRNNSTYNAKRYRLYMKLNGKSDETERLHAEHNAAVADTNHISLNPQHVDYMDWKNEDKISKKKQKMLRMYDAHQYGSLLSPRNKLRDTFAESLLYVNRLYNQEFGFEPRKVPAHMPHLINIDIMEHLQARFSQQWQLTSSHKVRNAHDMQFAFSYFYFLMSMKVTVPVADIFDMFDTDKSGTWSDREIRTLLTRSFDLPLSYARVIKFENDIMNCSKGLPEELSRINIPTPSYERYQDSKLPIVSKALISNCKPVQDMLMKRFGERKMYQFQVERDRHHDVSFKMLNSNISQLVSQLDDIRRDPKKFICLNDNLDPKRAEDNAVARAVLQDMYESLFPQPSTFELPPEFRNRFLHMTELQAWRTNRNIIRTVVYICLTILVTFTLVNFIHVECRWLQRKLCQRTRQQYHRGTPLVTSV